MFREAPPHKKRHKRKIEITSHHSQMESLCLNVFNIFIVPYAFYFHVGMECVAQGGPGLLVMLLTTLNLLAQEHKYVLLNTKRLSGEKKYAAYRLQYAYMFRYMCSGPCANGTLNTWQLGRGY